MNSFCSFYWSILFFSTFYTVSCSAVDVYYCHHRQHRLPQWNQVEEEEIFGFRIHMFAYSSRLTQTTPFAIRRCHQNNTWFRCDSWFSKETRFHVKPTCRLYSVSVSNHAMLLIANKLKCDLFPFWEITKEAGDGGRGSGTKAAWHWFVREWKAKVAERNMEIKANSITTRHKRIEAAKVERNECVRRELCVSTIADDWKLKRVRLRNGELGFTSTPKCKIRKYFFRLLWNRPEINFKCVEMETQQSDRVPCLARKSFRNVGRSSQSNALEIGWKSFGK